MRHDSDDLPADEFAEKRFRILAKGLTSFRRVDAVQPDSDRSLVVGQKINCIAVNDDDDFASDLADLLYSRGR